jgi:hypothetical protein
MGSAFFQPASEHVLEWVILLSLATSVLCGLAFVAMVFVGKWQLAVHTHKERTAHAIAQRHS